MLNWFKTSSKRKSSRKHTSKRPSKVVFVNGKPRTAQPNPKGSGYFYVKRSASGKSKKFSTGGNKTYTRTEAKSKMKSLSRKK